MTSNPNTPASEPRSAECASSIFHASWCQSRNRTEIRPCNCPVGQPTPPAAAPSEARCKVCGDPNCKTPTDNPQAHCAPGCSCGYKGPTQPAAPEQASATFGWFHPGAPGDAFTKLPEASTGSEQCVWFHGTQLTNVEAIKRDGFLPGTYFSRHMEDAAVYGGPCVFFVRVHFPDVEINTWQACSSNRIPADAIQKMMVVQEPRSCVSWKRLLVSKFPAFDPTWSEETKLQWFDDFIKLLSGAIHDQ